MTEVAQPPTVMHTETIVTESVETQSVPLSSVVVQETASTNGVTATEKTNGNSTPATNGSAKKAKKTKEPKPVVEPEPPKDPKEDPKGWLKQQTKIAVHKANFYLLDWVQKVAVEDEAKRQPLGKNVNSGLVTKSEFLNSLQDGTLLANLANKLSPGTVESVHEGEAVKQKENQVSNVQAFINFAKEKAGLSEEQVFSVEELREKGKAGYEAVFNTIFQIALKAQQQFNQAAIDVDRIAEDAKNAVQPNPLTQAINFFVNLKNTLFKKGSGSAADKQVAQQEEKAAEEATSAPNAVIIVEEQVNKVEVTPAPQTAVVSASDQLSSTAAVAN